MLATDYTAQQHPIGACRLELADAITAGEFANAYARQVVYESAGCIVRAPSLPRFLLLSLFLTPSAGFLTDFAFNKGE